MRANVYCKRLRDAPRLQPSSKAASLFFAYNCRAGVEAKANFAPVGVEIVPNAALGAIDCFGLFASMLPGSREAAFEKYGDRGHRDRWSSGQPRCRFALARLTSSHLFVRLPSGRRSEHGLWCRCASASTEKSGSSHARARVPPNFTAPAPCVRSPSGRRSGCAHPALPFG